MTTQRREQLHARLAYAGLTGAYDPELLTALYDCSIPYLSVVRDVLQPHSDQLATSLWDTLHDTGKPADRRFRAGLALATYATESEHWSAEDYALLAGQLVKENPIHQPRCGRACGRWLRNCFPIWRNCSPTRNCRRASRSVRPTPWRCSPAMMVPGWHAC